MSNKLTQNALIAMASAMATCASINAGAIEPQYIQLSDSTAFIPGLQIKESYDDNLHGDESHEQSSWITTVAPSFTLAGAGSKSSYLLSYALLSDTFHSSQEDNNADHIFNAETGLEFNARNRLKLKAGFRSVEDTFTQNQNQENDRSERSDVGGVYTYGARTARGQIDLGANYEELRYNNSDGLNSDEERDTTALKGVLYYRVAPLTRLLLEARHTDYDYLTASKNSSTNIDLLAGVTWEATAKTSGSIKVGRGQKDYEDSSIDDASTGMWEVGVQWKPRTYSTFSLSTRRAFDEGSNGRIIGNDGSDGGDSLSTNDDDSAVRLLTSTLGWKHYWKKHWFTDLSYSRTDVEYLDTNREDRIDGFSLGLTYEARRWLDVSLGYRHAENDSDLRTESYERNIYVLTFNASL